MVGGQANQPNHNNLRCGVIDPVIVSAAAAVVITRIWSRELLELASELEYWTNFSIVQYLYQHYLYNTVAQ